MSTPQRPPRAATAKWQIILGSLSIALGAALLVAGLLMILAPLRITRLYEDGSGELSDGRSFCIAGEPCDRRAP